jgi:signal transduction histidine kinase/DNA-binding response OmpR family regulator/anti-sigma regulatory factor (Ser/Thr protein kinase)
LTLPILTVSLRYENDVVSARQRARQIASLLGFERQDQTRISTAISEIARNAMVYGGGGTAEFALEGNTAPQVLLTTITDRGPGIDNLQEVLSGAYKSETGMGVGIMGARRLMDGFNIESKRSGTKVEVRKILPPHAPLVTREGLKKIVDALPGPPGGKPRTLLEELQQQNRELVQTLEELRLRQEELSTLNSELADTNRGVIALYAELDEKADHLRRADELKSKFLSNMSHEFRTPLNSILALTRLLLDRVDGDLTKEQEMQVGYVRRAADDLYGLVNDLLDLAKVEAGKIEVHPSEFNVADLFAALRGMLRPLLVNPQVNLVFEDPEGLPLLRTDEGKVSQILRNFISNALKFTTVGEIRVTARLVRAGESAVIPHAALGDDADAAPVQHDSIVFAVEDSGIGIPASSHGRIFQEFGQLENPIQRTVRGTGLGLSLSKKIAELLGGRLRFRSEEALGSTFAAVIPCDVAVAGEELELPLPTLEVGRPAVLIVEDTPEDRLIFERILAGEPVQPVFAATVLQAKDIVRRVRPVAIVLDIMLQGEPSWSLLAQFKQDPLTRDVPVIVATTLDDRRKGLGLGAAAYLVKPLDHEALRHTLRQVTGDATERLVGNILLIEDDEAHRYILRGLLEGQSGMIFEAADGMRGLEMAAAHRPAVILLDLGLPVVPGEQVLKLLKGDPRTADIPVVVVTSDTLDTERRSNLETYAAAVLSKDGLSRGVLLAAISSALATTGTVAGPEPEPRSQLGGERGDESVASEILLYNDSRPAPSGKGIRPL